MRTIKQTIFTFALVSFLFTGAIAQVCTPSAPVCVPGNGYAFRYASDIDFGLKFNTGTNDYEFTNGSGAAVFGVDAFTGNINIPGSGALQVGPNRYAFQFTLTPNYGLFFNAAGFAYEFRTSNASPILSIGANNGNVAATGQISGIGSGAAGGYGVKGLGALGPTNGYLGAQGGTGYDGVTGLDILGQEVGVLGVSTGASISDNYGVMGFSNNVGVTAQNSSNTNQVDLATPTAAITATGNASITGELEVNSFLNNSATSRGPFRVGSATGSGIAFDNNEVQSYSNPTTAGGTFYVNFYGGNVDILNTFGGDGNLNVHGGTIYMNGLSNNVGIGTAAPVSKLHLSYPTGVGNGLTMQNNTDADQWEMYVWSSNTLRLYFNGVQRGSFDDVSGVYTSSSDRKLKKNIEQLDGREMMDKIMALNPTKYHFNQQAESDDRKYYGLIAQEVKEVIPEIAVYFEAGDDGTDQGGQYGISYTELIPILIAGMQEQQTIITEKDETVKTLEGKVSGLESRMADLENALTQCCIGQGTGQIENAKSPIQQFTDSQSDSWLGQNVPNPFNNSTIIQFYIPESVSTSEIKVYDLKGQEIKSFRLESGYGEVEFHESDISSGSYVYSLINDGKIIATKKMILNK